MPQEDSRRIIINTFKLYNKYERERLHKYRDDIQAQKRRFKENLIDPQKELGELGETLKLINEQTLVIRTILTKIYPGNEDYETTLNKAKSLEKKQILINRTLLANVYPGNDEHETALDEAKDLENGISKISSSEGNIAEIGRITRMRVLSHLERLEAKTRERTLKGSYIINEIRDETLIALGVKTKIGLTDGITRLSQLKERIDKADTEYINTLTPDLRTEISNYLGSLIKEARKGKENKIST